MGLRLALRIPDPSESVDKWHVSPLIDTTAYAFSWLWVLVPMLLLGNDKLDYIIWYLLILAATDVHRHYNFPLVYLDAQVRRAYPARFWLFPAVMAALFVASPWLSIEHVYFSSTDLAATLAYAVVLMQVCRRDGSPLGLPLRTYALGILIPATVAFLAMPSARVFAQAPSWWWLAAALFSSTYIDLKTRQAALQQTTPQKSGFSHPRIILALMLIALAFGPQFDAATRHAGVHAKTVFNTVAIFAGAWNIWHIYMQKYGILRMYAVKSGVVERLPGALDRLLVFCWLPLYLAWLAPTYRELVRVYFRRGNHVLPEIIRFFDNIAPVAVPIAVLIVIGSLYLWVRNEIRVTGLRNRPRLVMAAGTTFMAAAFVVVDPVKAYLAYAFTHAIEYMVFVWAYQRKRYQNQLPHNPPLGRVLGRPLLAYATFTLGLGATFLYFKYYGRFIVPDAATPKAFGMRTSTIIVYWSVYQSMVHFYWDGFMWKMRLASLRAHL